jgi:hypothetical protein
MRILYHAGIAVVNLLIHFFLDTQFRCDQDFTFGQTLILDVEIIPLINLLVFMASVLSSFIYCGNI